MSLSVDEFMRLQTELMQLREFKYEANSREKKLLVENEKLVKQTRDLQRSQKTVSYGGKEKGTVQLLMEEVETLKRNMKSEQDAYMVQNEAMLDNMRVLNSANEDLELKLKEQQESLLTKHDSNTKNDVSIATVTRTENVNLRASLEQFRISNQLTLAYCDEIDAIIVEDDVNGNTDSSAMLETQISDTIVTWAHEALSRLKLCDVLSSSVKRIRDEKDIETEDVDIETSISGDISTVTCYGESNSDSLAPDDSKELNVATTDIIEKIVLAGDAESNRWLIEEIKELKASIIEIFLHCTKSTFRTESLNDVLGKIRKAIESTNAQCSDGPMTIPTADFHDDERIATMTATIKDLNVKLNSTESTLLHVQFDRDTALESVTSLESVRDSLSADVLELKNQLIESTLSNERIKNSEAENWTLRTSVSEMKDQIDALNIKISFLIKESDIQANELELTRKQELQWKSLVDGSAIEKQDFIASATAERETLMTDAAKREASLRNNLTDLAQTLLVITQDKDNAEAQLLINNERYDALLEQNAELEMKLKHLQNSLTNSESNIKDTHIKLEEALVMVSTNRQTAEMESSKLRDEINAIQADLVEAQQQIADGEDNRRVVERKGTSLLRDLKRQLASERKAVSRLENNLADARQKLNSGNISSNSSPLRNYGNALSKTPSDISESSSYTPSIMPPASSLFYGNNNNNNTPPINSTAHVVEAVDTINLATENNALLQRLSQTQSRKWALEEKVQFLEENSKCLAEELLKKNEIIRASMTLHQTGLAKAAAVDTMKNKGHAFSNMFGKAERQMSDRIQAILEEQVLKNIELQRDMDLLGQEVSRLSALNHQLQMDKNSSIEHE